MAGNARTDLIAALRSRISDDRPVVTAFALSATGECKSALVEVTNGFLVVSVEGGTTVDSLRFGLSEPSYSTVGRLIAALRRSRGYTVVPEPNHSADHPSSDLEVIAFTDIAKKASASFKHRIFSDGELTKILMDAISLHNPNYRTLTGVPAVEHPYVLLKAAALSYRMLAGDSARRKTLDTDAKTYLALANDLENQYQADAARMHRILPSAKADESKMGAGDVVVGTMFRSSLRSGAKSNMRNALPPTPPNLYDPSDNDVEDTIVRLRWSQSRAEDFSHYEIWRDNVPTVERCLSGRLSQQPLNVAQLPAQSQFSKFSTSKQILGSPLSQSPLFDGFFFWTAAETAGANLVNATFTDGIVTTSAGVSAQYLGEPLEPDTEYYYRVYAINRNGEIVASQVKRVRTKAMRSSFKRTNRLLASDAMSAYTGTLAGGQSVTINGSFVDGTRVFFGAKEATVDSLTSTVITITTPAYTNTDFIGQKMDVVLRSPNGLADLAQGLWSYT